MDADWFAGKGLLLSGACGAGAVLLRVVLEAAFSRCGALRSCGRIFVVVGPQPPAEDSAPPTQHALLSGLLGAPALRPLSGGGDPARLAALLSSRVQALLGDPLAGEALGLPPDEAARVQGEVDVVFHSWQTGDSCRSRPLPAEIAAAATNAAAFAGRCRGGGCLVLPAPALAAHASVRHHGAPSGTLVAEEPLELRFDPGDVLQRLLSGGRAADCGWLEKEAALPAPAAAAAAAAAVLSARAAEGRGARLCLVRHGLVGPPMHYTGAAPAAQGDDGGLQSLAFAVGVGEVDWIAGDPAAPLELVPADLLAGACLISPTLSPGAPVSVIHACTSAEHPLALGMAADYITNYWARNHRVLASALDSGMLRSGERGGASRLSPVLARPPILAVGTRGPRGGLRVAVRRRLRRRGDAAASHLARHPHSEVSARLREALAAARAAAARLHQPGGPTRCALRFSGDTLRSAAASGRWGALPLDVREAEWETYCKAVARDAFAALCGVLRVALTAPPPPPARYCDMDPLVAPSGGSEYSPPPGVHRRVLSDLHFLAVVNRQPSGDLISYTPGLSSERRQEIMNRPSVRAAITQQAQAERIEESTVEERAHAILTRIGDKLNGRALRVLGYALRKVMKTLYTHIHTNPDGYELMRRAVYGIGSNRSGRRAVVLIPTHRSYMDFLLASYVMFMWGLPVPHICSGEDFLRLAGVHHLLRGSGAFFMRRSFKGDRLYSALFKEYVRALVDDGRCIEFFIEGTRSRSGKTITPKLGILKFIYDAFFDSLQEGTGLADVVIVPVSMSYDKILEGSIYLRELHGHKKPPETLGNLLSSVTVLLNRFGTLNVTIGQPISLAEFALGEGASAAPPPWPQGLPALRRAQAELQPDGGTAAAQAAPPAAPAAAAAAVPGADKDPVLAAVEGWDGKRHNQLLSRLAWRITHDLQQGLIVSPCALFAATILYLHQPDELLNGLNQGTISGEVVWVREQVLRAGGHMVPSLMAQSGEELTAYAVGVLRPHVRLSRLNVLFMPDGDSLMLLSIYANQLVHLFADTGVVALSAAALPDGPDASPAGSEAPAEAEGEGSGTRTRRCSRSGVLRGCRFLRSLLCIEFPDWQPASPLSEDEWYARAAARACSTGVALPGPAAGGGGDVQLRCDAGETQLVCSVLQPLVEGYWLVATGLLALLQLGGKLREAAFIDRVGNAATELLRQEHLQFRTAADREVMRNALQRLKEMGAVATTQPQTVALASDWAADGAARLAALSAEINGYRWKPHTDPSAASAAVVAAVAGPAAMAASVPALPSKL
eukprot:TRINITY_DN2381_c1_g2_i2.p1 TRINITY_DN2381_c1_g2~~TRINITY_DN2381_c1_g2_i2.p1  ORF type:complete len:1297 (+),score=460.95 TRINITY_DN2381_c1_g2_i2:81-3971(+)